MKILKNARKKREAKIRTQAHIEYRKLYEKKFENAQLDFEIEIEAQQRFFTKQITKSRETERKKWASIVAERDETIAGLKSQINEKKELFQYLKTREQELENIINIIGTKYKAFAELVESGYGGIQQTFGHLMSYNKRHLKNDDKVVNAIKEG